MGNITTPLKARPTVYKGIAMRSRLEALYAAEFDEAEVPWEYEPEAFANQTGQYLPDFCLHGRDSHYCEIKGVVEDVIPIMKKMEIIWSSYPGSRLSIFVGNPCEGMSWTTATKHDVSYWFDSADIRTIKNLTSKYEDPEAAIATLEDSMRIAVEHGWFTRMVPC